MYLRIDSYINIYHKLQHMKNQIYTCLWFDGQAKAAADFYCALFEDSRITADTPMVVNFELCGKKIMGLNGGPQFKINPSISLFYICQTMEEIQTLWNQLSNGGSVLMALDKYPWSEQYGWVKDKFGMTWQLMLSEMPAGEPKIMPSMLFANTQYGNAEAAIRFYTSIFDHSVIRDLQHYQAGGAQEEGKLMFGNFILYNEPFAAMDGPGDHEFIFNEAVSFVVSCANQQEIDYFWDKLTEGGEESQCGWLKDKFGVSWQVVPANLGQLMSDPEKGPRVIEAFLKMKKFDLEKLENV